MAFKRPFKCNLFFVYSVQHRCMIHHSKSEQCPNAPEFTRKVATQQSVTRRGSIPKWTIFFICQPVTPADPAELCQATTPNTRPPSCGSKNTTPISGPNQKPRADRLCRCMNSPYFLLMCHTPPSIRGSVHRNVTYYQWPGTNRTPAWLDVEHEGAVQDGRASRGICNVTRRANGTHQENQLARKCKRLEINGRYRRNTSKHF